jgi:SAM-dependent MidA family methyltransferase
MRFSGCVFANELLDAMPVHRVTMRDGRLWELYVDVDKEDGFKEILGSPSTDALAERLDRLGVRLMEGYRTEINLGLENWLQGIKNSMECGYLIIIDYGHLSSIYYDETRRSGTLRCYYHHTVNANPYIHVGDQDISIHVDFSSVLYEAEKLGFKCCGYTTQSNFLSNLGLESYRIDIDRSLGYSRQVRRANLRALDTLADPDGMGGFKVMVFSKDLPPASLKGFDSYGSEDHKGFFSKPGFAPIAGPGHLAWKYINDREPNIASWNDILGFGR